MYNKTCFFSFVVYFILYFCVYYSQSAKLTNSSTIQSNSIVMEVVTGYSDWEFLRPDANNEVGVATLAVDQTTKKRRTTSLEDFDNELAVFQVNVLYMWTTCNMYTLVFLCKDPHCKGHSRTLQSALFIVLHAHAYVYL